MVNDCFDGKIAILQKSQFLRVTEGWVKMLNFYVVFGMTNFTNSIRALAVMVFYTVIEWYDCQMIAKFLVMYLIK